MAREPGRENGAGEGCYRGDRKPLYYNPFPRKAQESCCTGGLQIQYQTSSLCIYICMYEYSAYPERGHSIATQVTGKPTGLYYRYRGFSRGQCPAEDSVLYRG
jgi:hypothetical protein